MSQYPRRFYVVFAKVLTALGFLAMFLHGGLVNASADAQLQITNEEMFMIPVPVHQMVQLVDVLTVKNPLSRAQNVQIGLPQGFQNFSAIGLPVAKVKLNKDYATLESAAKQETSTTISISYELPIGGEKGVQFTVHSYYPVYVAKLYLPIGSAALSAQNLLISTQTVNVSGTEFRVFTRPGIPAGDDWTMSLQMLPPTSNASVPNLKGLPLLGSDGDNTGNSVQALGNLLLAGFVLVIGILSVRSTQWSRPSRVPVTTREALFRAWETIEYQYETGALEHGEYERRRKEVKSKILTLPDSKGRGGTTC